MEMHEIARIKMKKLGLTQKELAEKFGVEQPQISNALGGRNETSLIKVVEYLIEKKGVDRREFYPDDNERLFQLELTVKRLDKKIDDIYDAIKKALKESKD